MRMFCTLALAGWVMMLNATGADTNAVANGLAETNSPIARALLRANKLFEDKNWAEAREAFDSARGMDTNWTAAPVRLAVEAAVACSLKLQQWDNALERAQEFVTKNKGKFEEAAGE